MAPTDDDVWDRAAFVGSTHVTEPERAALAALRALGLNDVVPRPLKYDRALHLLGLPGRQLPQEHGHAHRPGLRDPAVADAVTDAYVDREARKGKGPSDHAPVVVDLDL